MRRVFRAMLERLTTSSTNWQMISVLDGRAVTVAIKNHDVQLGEANLETAFAIADLDSFALEPTTSVQKSVTISSVSNDAYCIPCER